jgi:hypothetical protein
VGEGIAESLTDFRMNERIHVRPMTTSAVLHKRRRRLRAIGTIVLLIGLSSAGIVYWVGTHSARLEDDPMMVGYSRPQERNMELLYGKMGRTIEDLSDDLKRPGTQAVLIAGVSVVIAAGCFYLAGPEEVES